MSCNLFIIFSENVRRVLHGTWEIAAECRGLTLGEAAFAESLFPECATPSATLGEHSVECF
jgi:hypothetical protein